jgi:hypothetical protein
VQGCVSFLMVAVQVSKRKTTSSLSASAERGREVTVAGPGAYSRSPIGLDTDPCKPTSAWVLKLSRKVAL